MSMHDFHYTRTNFKIFKYFPTPAQFYSKLAAPSQQTLEFISFSELFVAALFALVRKIIVEIIYIFRDCDRITLRRRAGIFSFTRENN